MTNGQSLHDAQQVEDFEGTISTHCSLVGGLLQKIAVRRIEELHCFGNFAEMLSA